MAEQLLREALNKVEVVGIAQESTLERKELKDKSTGTPYVAIQGDVAVKINEEETQIISYFAKELTKKGEPNKNFKALTTIMNEMVTIADVAQGLTEGEPSRIECQGKLALNEYKGTDGEIKSFPRINGQFTPTRFKGEAKDFKPYATFDIEGIVKATVAETDKDENETGRLKIQLYVPLYGGKVIPLSFVTSEKLPQGGKDYLTDNFVSRASVRVYGDLINREIKIEREIESGFGENKIEVTYERTREFVATGGTLYEEGVHKEAFDVSLLKEAIANRNRDLATLKEQVKEDKPKAGFGEGAKKESAPKPQEKKDDGLDDLFGED